MNHEENLRIFIAIPLSFSIIEYLSEIISSIKKQLPDHSIKWVKPENIHLTLRFLGNISSSKLIDLYKHFDTPLKIEPFELEITKLGAFPSIFKPHVVWVGLSESKPLVNLSLFINENTKFLGLENEESFSPHLTLARTRPGIKKENIENLKQLFAKNQNRILEPHSFQVNHFNIFQSTLTPNGPLYIILKTYKLQSQK